MKTAVSLPEELFRQAELAAKRLRVSRSELYARALSEFLRDQEVDSITRQLNEVYPQNASELENVLHRAQLASLSRDPWKG